MVAFVLAQVILVPILGGLYLGIKAERRKKEYLYFKSLSTIRVMRGRY